MMMACTAKSRKELDNVNVPLMAGIGKSKSFDLSHCSNFRKNSFNIVKSKARGADDIDVLGDSILFIFFLHLQTF